MKPVTKKMCTKNTVDIKDLKYMTSLYFKKFNGPTLAVLDHKKPVAYLLTTSTYEALFEKIEDIELEKIAKARLLGKSVRVELSHV